MTERLRDRVRAMELKCLRGIYGVSNVDRIQSQEIREKLQVQRIEEFVSQRLLGCWCQL